MAYTNADWANCLDMCRTTSGYALFLGHQALVVSRSSAEAEYHVVANGVAEAS